MRPIIAIIMIIVCLTLGGALIFLKKHKRKSKEILNKDEHTANEFVNVKDIKDRFLYTRDGQIIMYIKINPISIDLFSEREKKQLNKTLTAELSSEQKPFKFLAVSRPVDISPLINEYTQIILSTSDQKQKDLLRNEMLVMSNYALSGDVVERDLSKRCYEFVSKFESGSIGCEILKEQEIVRLCNLVNNPAYFNIEDSELKATILLL